MRRSSSRDSSDRVGMGISPVTVTVTNVSPKLQEVEIGLPGGGKATEVAVQYPYGYAARVKAPSDGKAAESHVLTAAGNRSHPIILPPTDRRFPAPKLKEGEVVHHDDQGQVTKIGRDGIETAGKTVQITGGGDSPKGDTANHELNEFAKGAVAELAQLKHHVAGLHYVTSRLRELTQIRVPEVAALAGILNKLPSGLDAMASDVQGQLQNYAQKQVQQALSKFLDPSLLLGLSSVLSGGIEGAIAALKSQIGGLLAANPVVGAVDSLRVELQALSASGGNASTIAKGVAELQSKIDALTTSNPIIGTVADLRSQLQDLLDQAGPGLHFLAVQQRAAQGKIRSVKFSND